MNKSALAINKLCLAAMFLSIGWLMPFLSLQIPTIGNMLCPMHIPVLLSGFVLGPIYGLFLGFITPLTRTLIFGMPVLYPTSICMAIELAVYGFVSGFLFRILIKKTKLNDTLITYISLISAMVLGRLFWGISRLICGLVSSNHFTITLFLSGAFITAWPGIILQLILIPSLVVLLKKQRIIDKFIYNDTI